MISALIFSVLLVTAYGAPADSRAKRQVIDVESWSSTDQFPEIHLPDIHLPEMPEIQLPEMPEIQLPEMPEIQLPEIPEIQLPGAIQWPSWPQDSSPDISLEEISDHIESIAEEIHEMALNLRDIDTSDFDMEAIHSLQNLTEEEIRERVMELVQQHFSLNTLLGSVDQIRCAFGIGGSGCPTTEEGAGGGLWDHLPSWSSFFGGSSEEGTVGQDSSEDTGPGLDDVEDSEGGYGWQGWWSGMGQ